MDDQDSKTAQNSKKTYTAALIIIGNEILSGRTQDANTAWLAEKLTARGVRIMEVRIIPDIEDVVVSTIKDIKEKVDYVLTTGGIGPTHDDITAACVAKAFDVKLESNLEAYKILEDYYGKEDLTDARAKMAVIPEGAKLINNPVTAAPGFYIGNVYTMAGVPRIMQAMFDHVVETMEVGAPMLSNTISCGLPESVVAPDLAELQKKHPDIEIGSYPHYRGGVLGLSLVLRSTNDELLDKATLDIIALVRHHGDEPRALNVRNNMILDVSENK